MQKLKAILTLIRASNLLFICLTQILTYYFIIIPSLEASGSELNLVTPYFYAIAFSTFLIAAAGYIINDYFDIGTDAINKPEKVTIEKYFKRRTIIIWHIILNVIALLIASYVALHIFKLRLALVQVLCIFLLTVYSTTFKRKLILGNIIIAILTSLTIICVAVYEPNFKLVAFNEPHVKLLWVYITFAFSITLIREIVKDIEDVKGDVTLNCKTIPLVWGIDNAKKILFVLISIIFILLIIAVIVFWKINLMMASFFIIAVFIPLVFILRLIVVANTSHEFNKISSYIKWVTLLGILSMLLH